MKKTLILTAICTSLAVPATAVQKCVALNKSNTTCTSSYEQYNDKIDWEATCTTNGTRVPIKGIGVCSSNPGSTGDTIDVLTTTNIKDANIYCWCKMTSPAMSSWVATTTLMRDEACDSACSAFCVYHMTEDPILLPAILGSLEK